MAIHGRSGLRASGQAALIGVLSWVCLLGCDRGQPVADALKEASQAAQAATGDGSKPSSVDPRYTQSFADATRSDPPADWQRPPDLTLAGKSVGKLYTEIVRIWDKIPLTTNDGKLIDYAAVLDTDLGPIEIGLRPDLAPNHVRNFIALASVGFYDGLVFERTVHARSDEHPEEEVDLVEGGCPIGTGELGFGSLGYWLKPEFSKENHDVGTLGACHGVEPDTAACRFYITLTKAPLLDGNFTVFGKVTRGVDVARRIFSLPVRNDPEYPEGDRPEKPVVIRKVTITPPAIAQDAVN